MRVGVPREIKVHEYRVAITPAGVDELVRRGHQVLVEHDAGAGSSITDEEFVAAGAKIVPNAADVWGDAELILKVKEPIEPEYGLLRRDQVLFTYLHLAASQPCTQALVDARATAVAYETVQLADGSLPLLYPMSEVAGRMAPQVGAHCLERECGGRGVLMGGVSGVRAARVVILGAGVAGMNAAAVSVGMWADTAIIDVDIDKLRRLDRMYKGQLQTVASNSLEIERSVSEADLVIGAVLVAGAKAPRLVSRDLVRAMKPGSVLVDIAIDQGGCFEDSHPTTHSDPTYEVEGSVFYCVANMPGAVPHSSTHALTNVTLPYALRIADHGLAAAVEQDAALARGVNVVDGTIVYDAVAAAHSMASRPLADMVAAIP
jgi:alanine dehydrogenase